VFFATGLELLKKRQRNGQNPSSCACRCAKGCCGNPSVFVAARSATVRWSCASCCGGCGASRKSRHPAARGRRAETRCAPHRRGGSHPPLRLQSEPAFAVQVCAVVAEPDQTNAQLGLAVPVGCNSRLLTGWCASSGGSRHRCECVLALNSPGSAAVVALSAGPAAPPQRMGNRGVRYSNGAAGPSGALRVPTSSTRMLLLARLAGFFLCCASISDARHRRLSGRKPVSATSRSTSGCRANRGAWGQQADRRCAAEVMRPVGKVSRCSPGGMKRRKRRWRSKPLSASAGQGCKGMPRQGWRQRFCQRWGGGLRLPRLQS
jgi:hypothetical protein